jgi:hypothetical protein
MDTHTLKKSHNPKQFFHLTIVSIKHPTYNTHLIKKIKNTFNFDLQMDYMELQAKVYTHAIL